MKIKFKILLLLLVLLVSGNGVASSESNKGLEVIEFLQNMFNKSDAEIDLAQVKISIDKFIDPSINTEKTLTQIDRMANEFKAGLAPNMKPLDQALSLSAFLYEAGTWNNMQPLQYDFTDPFGVNVENKLLSTYLKSKSGNCISMPMLYVILAQRLNLDATLSTAPLHVFVKFKNSISDEYVNLEATDRGRIVSSEFYRVKTTITEQAIQNRLYLQPLSKKQSVAVMAILLSEYFDDQEQWEGSINVAKLILQYYPNYAYAMIKVGNGYSKLLQQKLAEVKEKGTYTPSQKETMDKLYKNNLHWFKKAEQLGWVPIPLEENETYLNSLKNAQNQILKLKKESNDDLLEKSVLHNISKFIIN